MSRAGRWRQKDRTRLHAVAMSAIVIVAILLGTS
jgi:hypothetical protein